MDVKLVLRLLDSSGQLLGWTPVQATARGDGRLTAPSVVLKPELSGVAEELVIHWPDLHVQKRTRFAGPVTAGIPLLLGELVWIIPSDEGSLPPVTIDSAAIIVPTGSMGARDPRLG